MIQHASGSVASLLQSVLTVDQIRAVDQVATTKFGMHSLVLMENAALGCVQWIVHRFERPMKTVVLCGSGNNGGDGLVIARHLRTLGWDCSCIMLGPAEKFSSDASFNANILQAGGGIGLSIVTAETADFVQRMLLEAELIVDAMLGTGAAGNPRSPFDDWIRWANSTSAFRLAIDVPTGIHADTGETAEPFFQADATLTFVAFKPSMTGASAQRLYGTLQVLPIGIPEQQITEHLEALKNRCVGSRESANDHHFSSSRF